MYRLAVCIGIVAASSSWEQNIHDGYICDRHVGYRNNERRNYDRPWAEVEKEVRDDYYECTLQGDWKYIENRVVDARMRWRRRKEEKKRLAKKVEYYEDESRH
jgi:hypothetical protein